MTRETTGDNLRDIIEALGSVPRGRTNAELLDEVERLVGTGGGVTPEMMTEIVDRYLEAHGGGLSDEDMDAIFSD